MASLLTVPQANSRPQLTRSRSISSPTDDKHEGKAETAKRPSRPLHIRSHSYMSPDDIKPTNSASFPLSATEKAAETSRFPRLHLPGKHHHHHHGTNNEEAKSTSKQHGRHRYTQSEAYQYHRKRDSALLNHESPNTPGWTTTPASSASEQQNDALYPASRGTAIPSLMRMKSYSRGTAAGDGTAQTGPGVDGKSLGRGRSNTDPMAPIQEGALGHARPTHKSPIEILLERADLFRRTARENASEDDIKLMDRQLKQAREELHNRIVHTTRSASDIMRRLDDTQDELARTLESLVDTISSFSNLSDQSLTLISNFEHESQHLDHEFRQRISRFRYSISKNRSQRVEGLEKRGQAMSQKAEELGRRLENCRTIVKNWEERETNKRKAWRGVWVGIAWGVALITIAILAGIASWKMTQIHRGGGTPVEQLRYLTAHNKSYDASVVERMNVPDNVKEILLDINNRARGGPSSAKPVLANPPAREDGSKESHGFRLLDEL